MNKNNQDKISQQLSMGKSSQGGMLQQHTKLIKNPEEKLSFFDKLQERVFHIRLKQANQEVDISQKPNLVKILEQEYACRYLESLNIEPTQKNINMILKMYPLKNCEITASWKNDSGLYADTITIISRKNEHEKKKKDKKKSKENKESVSKEMIEALDLRKIQDPNLKLLNNKESVQQVVPEPDIEEKKEPEPDEGFQLNFDPESIKKKYIYPFNQNFQSKLNVGLKDDEDLRLPQLKEGPQSNEKYLIYESQQYCFPFTQVKLEQNELKDLQKPLTIEIPEIQNMRKIFNQFDKKSKNFPLQMIPSQEDIKPERSKENGEYMLNKEIQNLQGDDIKNFKKKKDQKEFMKGKHITFKNYEIQSIFQILESVEMARMIGIFCHFSYWNVFGNVNPIQLDSLAKKQMYVTLFEIREYFSQKISKKLFFSLGMPLIILVTKMASEQIFRNSYSTFFEESSFSTNSAANIALDKIFYLLEQLFDETNFFRRFTFLESDFKTLSKQSGSNNDRKWMRNRLYATSPFMDLMITHPQDSKTRAIMAKKHTLDTKEYMSKISNIQQNANQALLNSIPETKTKKNVYQDDNEKKQIDQIFKQKMVNLVLNKVMVSNSKSTNKKNQE